MIFHLNRRLMMAKTNHSKRDQGGQSQSQLQSGQAHGNVTNSNKKGMGVEGAMRDQTNDSGERPEKGPGQRETQPASPKK
jgi:hypothetical protein